MTLTKKTLLIVDGHNVCLRAYFGLLRHNLRNKDGVGTWGVFGAINTIASQARVYQPTHILVTLDWGRSSKRVELYPEYKANRGPSSSKDESSYEESRDQIALFIEFCNTIRLPLVRQHNIEADDIIAKAAKTYRDEFDQIVILSSDHDIKQLIDEKTSVVKPSLGTTSEQIFDLSKMIDYYGIEPKRLPELWALTGDSGDNVPGVPGIGEKTAMKLIKQYGSLEAVLQSGEKKIVGYEDLARLSFKLVELDGLDDIPFPTLEELVFAPVSPGDYDSEELVSFFDEYELSSVKSKWELGLLWRDSMSIGRRLGDSK